MRQSSCKWVSRDEHGRPSCEHGPAHKCGGGKWTCSKKSVANLTRYRKTAAGKQVVANYNASESAKSTKQLYDLTRVR